MNTHSFRVLSLSLRAVLRAREVRTTLRLSTSGKMAAPEKPYVYQCSDMHSDLQRMLDGEFHMVRPGEEAKVREKISAIFSWVVPITGELIASFPNVKVVGNCAVGFDHVDLRACAERGVRVGNTPNVLNKATADMTWALLLSSARRVVEGDSICRSPDTSAFDPNWMGHQEVSGTTLGIVGMGRIGYEIAKRATGFEMKVLYHNRRQKSAEEEERVGATFCPTLEELLRQSDYVVLAAPATPETHRMIGRDQLKIMKRTSVFVNISRGSLVDQDALVEALRDGTISAAGLDVTDPEPLPRDHPLLTLTNVTITPHTGSATLHTRKAMMQMTIDNINAVLQGKPMISEVPLPTL